VGLRPELLVSVFVFVGDLLESGPAEDGVVANKGTDVPTCYSEADSGVDQVCKEGNSILSSVSPHVHRETQPSKEGGKVQA